MATKNGQSSEEAGAAPAKAGGIKRAESIQVVVFTLGDELFAIDLFDVKEVVEFTTITKLPNVPPYIRGIIDLRGEITSIIDLKYRLNIAAESQELPDTSRIIVLDSNITRAKTGILVDDVTSVSTFEGSQVDYTSASVSNEDTSIIGIIKRKVKKQEKEKNELIIWIDIRRLLGDFDT
ncbi:chemotaxis protein CheW [Methanoregula sp.]|uniref:chemotaxis protein CheW n=1 Tax=Methanoregula sp. TaxID=2052170 RepID=UPI003565D68D